MYHILIAEDEPIERNVIKYLIQEYHFPLQVYEASNGKEALEILAGGFVDILLTDVRMPIMDGLELAGNAVRLYPDIPIIFFSNYNDFSYAKKALELHAVNYIMKPIDPDEFETTVSSVLSGLKERESSLQKNQNQLHIIQNHILYKLVNRTTLEQLSSLYPQVDLSFADSCDRLILFQLQQEYFHILMDDEEASFLTEPFEHLLPSGSHFINLNPAQNVLLLTGSSHSDSWYESLASRLSAHIEQTCRIHCHTAISRHILSADDIAPAFEETEQELTKHLFTGNTGTDTTASSTRTGENDDTILKALQMDIQVRDATGLRSHIMQLMDTAKNNRSYSQLYFRFLCTRILNVLLSGLPAEKKQTSFDDYAATILRSASIAPIETLLLRLADKLSASFESTPDDSAVQVLNQVRQYIHNHYSEDLSLEILAQNVYLSPNYLSKLFAEYNGSGINKYIKKVRMEKAKDLLLHTPLSIREIAAQVGYSSDSYFCKSFTKDFDITPDKFRSQNSNLSERI